MASSPSHLECPLVGLVEREEKRSDRDDEGIRASTPGDGSAQGPSADNPKRPLRLLSGPVTCAQDVARGELLAAEQRKKSGIARFIDSAAREQVERKARLELRLAERRSSQSSRGASE